jgi:hypothetical protein
VDTIFVASHPEANAAISIVISYLSKVIWHLENQKSVANQQNRTMICIGNTDQLDGQ